MEETQELTWEGFGAKQVRTRSLKTEGCGTQFKSLSHLP
jgi:hypothetical protein